MRPMSHASAMTSRGRPIEYSIVAAGIAIAVAGTIRVLGATVLTNLYNQIAAAF